MPNPANQACSVCHTAAPANYTTLATNAVLHTGISTGCIACHGAPNATKPVFANNFTPKPASGFTPPHIPTSTTACESCHSKTTFTAFSGTTMNSAKHTAMFAVIGGTCDACHETGRSFYGVNNLTVRPNGHHVGKDCNGCHSPNNWNGNAAKRPGATAPATTRNTVGLVVNTGVAARNTNGPLASGLAGQALTATPGVGGATPGLIGLGSAGGGRLGHGPIMASVSHAGVMANCVSCHNGVLAPGKGAAHIASNNSCENCHTTLGWMPARFDHRGVTAACVSCHNGVMASGKPTRHIQTTQDCSACHGTLSWPSATFSHVGINATCKSCHNGITATAKQVQHVSTTLDCGSCHSTLNWTVTSARAPLKPLLRPNPRPNPSPRGPTNGPNR
jgi:hypothetical protein